MVDWSFDGNGSVSAARARPVVRNSPRPVTAESFANSSTKQRSGRVKKVVDGKVYHVRVKKVKR
ncbi:MAG: hypothetical protein CMB16_01650 [Euryarchaeota archaeon]|nr:hypothetical protein [Euryarchaeota archaeon]